MDLWCTSVEECVMVAEDSLSSEDLDDSIVTFGKKSSERKALTNYTMNKSLNRKVVQKKKIVIQQSRKNSK